LDNVKNLSLTFVSYVPFCGQTFLSSFEEFDPRIIPEEKIVLEKSRSVPYNIRKCFVPLQETCFAIIIIKMKSSLDNISIVLVDTKTPANIGSVARAMMNMGFSRLVLVDPPEDKHGEAHKLAAGAHEILDKAEVRRTLEDAVSDQGLVIGTSRHKGRRRRNIHTPREMAAQAVPLLTQNKVSLVFGNEVNGLENTDLALCHELISIPSSAAFSSLNLSHAVMVVMYEFFVASTASSPGKTKLAPDRELEGFYEHMKNTLLNIDFIDDRNMERLMLSLRQLFGRTRLDAREVRILRGILSAVDRSSPSKQKDVDK
jgi:TrmH family RNA methyltransferase